jgi:hypothetical protein
VVVDSTIEGGGETKLFGDQVSGSDSSAHDGGPGAPELTIDVDMVFGQVEVHTEEAA